MEQRGRRRKAGSGEPALPRAQKDGVLATDMGDEIVLYDSRNHRGHCLNRSAAVVYRHLDGRTSVADLAGHLRRELDAPAADDMVWLALRELDKAELLDGPLHVPKSSDLSRRGMLRRMGAAAGAGAVLLPAVTSMIAPPAHAQVSAQGCQPPDTCQTFTCPGSCACVPTTEGTTVCIVPTCVAPCNTTADCPPGTVCFTLGCCGPATFCVPIAAAGQQCLTATGRAWQRA